MNPKTLRFLLFATLLFVLPLKAAQAEPDIETKLTAAFLYQFTKFIEWPRDNISERDSFEIGVAQNAALFIQLQEITKDKQVKEKKISIVKDTASDISKKHHLVFIQATDSAEVERSLKKLKGCGCLTVTYSEGMGEKGAMINFFREGEKLRFEINRKAAEQEHLVISSQLLKLARLVE